MSLTLILILIGVLVIAFVAYFLFFRKKEDADLTDDERAILNAKEFDQFEIKAFRKHALLSSMFRAIDKESKKAVALRILRPEFTADPDEVKSFLRRGEILEYLNKQHPDLSLVRLLKYGQAQFGRFSRPFIAVEYFEGMDLSDLLDRKKVLTVSEATSIIKQIARILSVALREKVWHHHLAFQAIMVRYTESGTLESKLVDFDVAKQDVSTISGQAAGGINKLTFMSPEQFENKIVDERSDIYSLGVIYYTLLTGRPPFMDGDFGEMARLHTTVPPPPMPAHVPQNVQAVVSQMLAKQPLVRYRTMDEVVRAVDSLTPDASWGTQPDTSAVKPLPRRVEETAPAARATQGRTLERESRAGVSTDVSSLARGKGSLVPRPPVKRFGGFLSLILLEFPLMFVSFIGRVFTKVLAKVSVKKIALVVLLAIVGVVAYFMIHVETVDGTFSLLVKDRQGKPIAGAAVVIDPVGFPQGGYVKFVDLANDLGGKGRFESKTSTSGELKAKYSVSPNTKLLVNVTAQAHTSAADTIMIRGDSVIALSYALTSTAVAQQLTVIVRDGSRNPVPSVSVIIVGNLGKEYPATVDERGMAKIQYDVAAEGANPSVSLSAEALGPEFARSDPKPQRISSMQLMIDINNYFPYDRTIDGLLSQAQSLIGREKWREAAATLQQLVSMQPGQGSARGYTLLAQALFEDDDKNYNEALKALRKAALDERNIKGRDRESTIEKMYYYRVRALQVAWDHSKEPGLKQDAWKACRQYLNLFQGGSYNALLKASDKVRDHHDKVKDIEDDVK